MTLGELVEAAKTASPDWERFVIGISATSDGLHWVNTDNVEIEVNPEYRQIWISEVGY